MSERKTGGPAFPYSALAPDARGLAPTMYADNCGMTLRDYFAAKALQGCIATLQWSPDTGDDPVKVIQLAEDCYKLADAMLAERDK